MHTFAPSLELSLGVPSFEAKHTTASENDRTRTEGGRWVSRDAGLHNANSWTRELDNPAEGDRTFQVTPDSKNKGT